VNTAPKLVLLDVGMVAELTPEDQHNLVGFFKVSLIRPPLVAPLLPPCSSATHLLSGGFRHALNWQATSHVSLCQLGPRKA